METTLVQQRQEAHLLLDGLPEEKFIAVFDLLAVMADRPSRLVARPSVEEVELTLESIAELDRTSAALDRGEGVSHEEMLRYFGH